MRHLDVFRLGPGGVALALWSCLAWVAPAVSQAADASRPNILVFIADDLGGTDSGPYGNEGVRTPNLDRLAREGIRFDAAMLTCSSCSPSRASILTGRYPHNTGAEQLHWPVPAEQTLVAGPLSSAGYWTAAVGKWHLGSEVKRQFHLVQEGPIEKWPQAWAARPQDRPFFLWFAFTDPHRPYAPGAIPRPHSPADTRVPPYMPDVPEVREDLALYYDEIARLDGVVGQVLDRLEAEGLTESTMVVFLSDNGRPFPRAKTTVYDSGIQTPLLVRYPALVTPGRVFRHVVSSIDLAPTFVELAGAERPATFQGTSLVPVLRGQEGPIREFAFAEHNWHDYQAYDRAVRSDRYKYIRNGYTELNLSPPADAVRSPSYAAMQALRTADQLPPDARQCFDVPRPAEELYDLEADPHELRNLAGDPAYRATLDALRSALDRWQAETRDRPPPERTPDEYDRTTGERLAGKRGRTPPRPELRAESP